MEKSKRTAGRPPGTTAEVMEKRREAEGLDRFGLPLEPPQGKVGARLRPQHQDEVRAKIQASRIVERLQKCADGEIEMTPAQIKASDILLSKSLPTLAATELTTVNNNDRLTEREIMEKVQELLKANPQLLQRLPAVLDGQAVQVGGGAQVGSGVPSPQAPACTLCQGGGLPGGCVVCGTMGGEERAIPSDKT